MRWTAHGEDHDAHARLADERWDNHRREHEKQDEALEKAHAAAIAALKAALADHHREHEVHAAAHEREHLGHSREHQLNETALKAAAEAVDHRLEGMNEVRLQLREQATTFASSEKLDAFMASVVQRFDAMQATIGQRFADVAKHTDDRYEDNRKRIEAIEKLDTKAEGRTLGQGAIVALIVTAIGIVGGLLGIVVVLSNFATP